MLEYNNPAVFLQKIKRENDIVLIEYALRKMQHGKVEELQRLFCCIGTDVSFLAVKIYEAAIK